MSSSAATRRDRGRGRALIAAVSSLLALLPSTALASQDMGFGSLMPIFLVVPPIVGIALLMHLGDGSFGRACLVLIGANVAAAMGTALLLGARIGARPDPGELVLILFVFAIVGFVLGLLSSAVVWPYYLRKRRQLVDDALE